MMDQVQFRLVCAAPIIVTMFNLCEEQLRMKYSILIETLSQFFHQQLHHLNRNQELLRRELQQPESLHKEPPQVAT